MSYCSNICRRNIYKVGRTLPTNYTSNFFVLWGRFVTNHSYLHLKIDSNSCSLRKIFHIWKVHRLPIRLLLMHATCILQFLLKPRYILLRPKYLCYFSDRDEILLRSPDLKSGSILESDFRYGRTPPLHPSPDKTLCLYRRLRLFV